MAVKQKRGFSNRFRWSHRNQTETNPLAVTLKLKPVFSFLTKTVFQQENIRNKTLIQIIQKSTNNERNF